MAGRLPLPPPRDGDPRESLRWARRVEMICGVLLVVCGVTVMDDGLPRWVVIGCGVLALLPWLGPAAILRRAERNPDVLIWDPARRADRAGRVAIVTTASQALIGGVVGYLIDGLGFAILMAVFLGAIGAVVSALIARRSTPR